MVEEFLCTFDTQGLKQQACKKRMTQAILFLTHTVWFYLVTTTFLNALPVTAFILMK